MNRCTALLGMALMLLSFSCGGGGGGGTGGGGAAISGTITLPDGSSGYVHVRARDMDGGGYTGQVVLPASGTVINFNLKSGGAKRYIVAAYLSDSQGEWQPAEGDWLGVAGPVQPGQPVEITLSWQVGDYAYVCSDSADDFTLGSNPFGPVDLQTLGMAFTPQALIVRVKVSQPLPTQVVQTDGDRVLKMGYWLALDQDLNPNTGDTSSGGAESLLAFNLDMEHQGVDVYLFYAPTGIEEPEDQRYAGHDRGMLLAGGPGSDYVLAAYPVQPAGLPTGMTFNLEGAVEAESETLHHYSFDAIGGCPAQ